MYIVNQALGVRKGLNKRWTIVDLTLLTMRQLYDNFRIVQIELTLPNSANVVYLNLQDVAAAYATYDGKFSDVLTSLGNASLPTTTSGYVLNKRKAMYRDAFRAGYTVTPVNNVNVIDASVEQASLPNVRLTRSDQTVDYRFAFNHCLVNVNGYFHRTDTDGINGLMVVDAMKSLRISKQNQIGILSFMQMCDIQIVPITPVMLNTDTLGHPLLNLSMDLTNKTIMLIFGGYPVFLDGNVLKQVGNSLFSLDMTQLGLIDRLYESLNYIDLSSLGLNTSPYNSSEVAIADLTSTDVVKAWFALSQTFAVVLNAPEIYTQRQAIARIGVPNAYIAYSQPNDLLQLELGRTPSYWSVYEDKQWRLNIYNNVIGNELYYTNPLPSWIYTSGSLMPGMPGRLSQACLLEIGRDY